MTAWGLEHHHIIPKVKWEVLPHDDVLNHGANYKQLCHCQRLHSSVAPCVKEELEFHHQLTKILLREHVFLLLSLVGFTVWRVIFRIQN